MKKVGKTFRSLKATSKIRLGYFEVKKLQARYDSCISRLKPNK